MTLLNSYNSCSSCNLIARGILLGLFSSFIISTAEAGAIRHNVNGDGEDDVIDWVPQGKGEGKPMANAPLRSTPSSAAKVVNKLARATANGYGISYHGGPVIAGTTNIYYIWYGNWAGNTAPTILTDFAQHLSGSGYMNIHRTYSTSAQTVTNQVTFGKSTTDNYSQGTTMNDVGVYNSVVAAITSGRLPADPNGVYFVLSSKDVAETTGFCSSYCAWHSSGGVARAGNFPIRYAFVGNPDRCPATCSLQTVSPNGNAGADGMANSIAHELSETITDPDSSAWYDATGLEDADKCGWTTGTTTTTAGYKWNVTLGTRKYLLQQLWINAPKVTGTTVTNGYCGLTY